MKLFKTSSLAAQSRDQKKRSAEKLHFQHYAKNDHTYHTHGGSYLLLRLLFRNIIKAKSCNIWVYFILVHSKVSHQISGIAFKEVQRTFINIHIYICKNI